MTVPLEARPEPALEGEVPGICRACHNSCGIMVRIEGGRAVHVTGDRDNPMSEGYSCVKGRELPAMLNHPDRLLRPLARREGEWTPIGSEQAMDEIAEALQSIVERHGPRSVAVYTGTMAYISSPILNPMAMAFAQALGTPMLCTPATIDQPGKGVALGLHGTWMAPTPALGEGDVSLVVGVNPLVSHVVGSTAHPGKWLGESLRRGMKLIVVDPRRSEFARRAHLHLQPRPGEDVAVLAGMLRVILDEGLYDREFLAENVDGIEALKKALTGYSAQESARRAGIDVDDLVSAARMFATSGAGWAGAGTGPNMAQSGTLLEYLLLTLRTVGGNWPRAGEQVGNPGTLIPALPAKAQAIPPFPSYGIGEQMRVHGLGSSLYGIPTAAIPDEILLGGEGQIRALVSVGGNPVVAWPDQLKTVEALRSLELLVQVDPWMSQTAKLAHYVIPPKMCLETPNTAQFISDLLVGFGVGGGRAEAYGQYAPAIVEAPAGSDVLEEWEFLYGLATRMELKLTLMPALPHMAIPPFEVDMEHKPTSDELLEALSSDGRISFDEVKRFPHGQMFPDPPVYVEPKDPDWPCRLDIGNAEMMADLQALLDEPGDQAYPFRLISRRTMHMYNSSVNIAETNRGRAYNPAFMHPEDLERLGIAKRDLIDIRSARASIVAVAEVDESVRPGCVSMTHAFGGTPEFDDDVLSVGSPAARLLSFGGGFDRYSGQPRMSNIPVEIRPHEAPVPA